MHLVPLYINYLLAKSFLSHFRLHGQFFIFQASLMDKQLPRLGDTSNSQGNVTFLLNFSLAILHSMQAFDRFIEQLRIVYTGDDFI